MEDGREATQTHTPSRRRVSVVADVTVAGVDFHAGQRIHLGRLGNRDGRAGVRGATAPKKISCASAAKQK